jgi:uncharacterized protein
MDYFLCVIGMVLVIEGIPYFGFPDKMKEMMAFVLEQDDSSLRMAGAVMMIAGLVIVILARSGLAN